MRRTASALGLATALCAALALAACGQEETPTTGLPNPSVEEAIPPADAPTTAPATPAVAVSLEGEGLRFIVTETGSARPLGFGAEQAQVVTATTNALGQPTAEGDQQECGPGPLHYVDFGDQLRLWFQDGAFAGWESDIGPISTMNGISADSSLADLRAAGVTEFNDTTLGQQFELAGLYGIMDESGQAVAVLFSGANCFAG